MRLNPYLTFDGQCEMAFRFYEQCLGGRIQLLMKYGDSPMAGHVPPDWGGKIIHGTFALGDQILSGADVSGEQYAKRRASSCCSAPTLRRRRTGFS